MCQRPTSSAPGSPRASKQPAPPRPGPRRGVPRGDLDTARGTRRCPALAGLWHITAIHPTVPGKVEGIISMSPMRVQCQQCGHNDDADSLGINPNTPNANNLVVLLSKILFHALPFPDGTENRRMCRPCRLSHGCECRGCADERAALRGL